MAKKCEFESSQVFVVSCRRLLKTFGYKTLFRIIFWVITLHRIKNIGKEKNTPHFVNDINKGNIRNRLRGLVSVPEPTYEWVTLILIIKRKEYSSQDECF